MAHKSVAVPNLTDKAKLLIRFMRSVRRSEVDDCWMWAGTLLTCSVNGWSYGCLKINGRTVRAHRASFALFYGAVPKDKMVLHSCDTPLCVNPEHLRLGVHADNIRDRNERCSYDWGKNGARGSANYSAKLVEADIPIIRRLLRDGLTNVVIAKMFGVQDGAVSAIKLGKSWKHVPDE